MDNNTNMKSVILGWVMLAGAYILGKRHGREKCINECRDKLLKKIIEEKEEKGS